MNRRRLLKALLVTPALPALKALWPSRPTLKIETPWRVKHTFHSSLAGAAPIRQFQEFPVRCTESPYAYPYAYVCTDVDSVRGTINFKAIPKVMYPPLDKLTRKFHEEEARTFKEIEMEKFFPEDAPYLRIKDDPYLRRIT